MKKLVCMIALACAASSSLAQAPAAPAPAAMPSVQLPPELDRVLRDYEKRWSAADAAGVAALFSADGMALPNGSLPARGLESVTAAYKRNAGGPLALRAIAYSMSGDMAYIVGGFARKAGEPDGGKFILVLRRGGDGHWMIAADMDNMNAMPRRAAAPASAPAPTP